MYCVRWKKGAALAASGAILIAALLATKGSLTSAETKAPPTVTPFVLETEAFFFEKTSHGQLAERDVEAHRSDGTRATVATIFYPGGRPRIVRVIHYPDGRVVRLADEISAKTTWPSLATRQVASRRMNDLPFSKNNCTQPWEALLRFDLLLGRRVAVVKTIPVSLFGTTSWRDPDLGCETLQSRVETVNKNAAVVQTERRAVSLKLEEPDPKLFDEGAGYAELRPSELLRKMAKREGSPWTADLQKYGDREDERYFELKRNAAPPSR